MNDLMVARVAAEKIESAALDRLDDLIDAGRKSGKAPEGAALDALTAARVEWKAAADALMVADAAIDAALRAK